MEQNKMSVRHFVALIVGGLTALIYLLYFVGRTYSDAYLSALKIPAGIMNYSLEDYAYFGARIDNLIITLLFTSIVVGFLLYLFPLQTSAPVKSYRKSDLIVGLGYFIYFAAILAGMVVFIVFAPSKRAAPPLVFGILMACTVTVGCSILLLYDTAIASRIKRGKIISKLFVTGIAITLICFPYMSANAWGTFKGIIKSDRYPLVELHATYQVIDDVRWEVVTDNSLRTAEDLHLILSNDKYLILKSGAEPSNVYIVRLEDILSTKIIGSQK